MNTFTSRDAEAVGEFALARLDDDGAPPAVTRPQNSDSHDHYAIRQGHTGKLADRLAETAAVRLTLVGGHSGMVTGLDGGLRLAMAIAMHRCQAAPAEA